MNLKTRKILSWFFLAAFFLITPAVIFYALGYKINPRSFRLQKTGTLIVESKPRGAAVYLDGKAREQTFGLFSFNKNIPLRTPVKIKNLLPHDYELETVLDGYWPRREKIKIEGGRNTIIDNAILIKKILPLLSREGETKFSSVSPDGKKLFFQNELGYWIVDSEKGTYLKLELAAAGSLDAIIWSSDNAKIIIDKIIFGLSDGKKIIELNDFIETDAVNLKFDRKDNDIVYYQTSGKLFSFDLGTKKTETIYENQETEDYLIAQNQNILIKTENGSCFAALYSKKNALIKNFELPCSGNYRFIHESDSRINIYDSGKRILYLIDQNSSEESIKEIDDIAGSRWTENGRLIYWDDFEIWIYDPVSGQKNILTRISEEIKEVFYQPNGDLYFYATDRKISVFYRGSDGKINFIDLVNFSKVRDLLFSSGINKIFFYGEIGNRKGIYELEI